MLHNQRQRTLQSGILTHFPSAGEQDRTHQWLRQRRLQGPRPGAESARAQRVIFDSRTRSHTNRNTHPTFPRAFASCVERTISKPTAGWRRFLYPTEESLCRHVQSFYRPSRNVNDEVSIVCVESELTRYTHHLLLPIRLIASSPASWSIRKLLTVVLRDVPARGHPDAFFGSDVLAELPQRLGSAGFAGYSAVEWDIHHLRRVSVR